MILGKSETVQITTRDVQDCFRLFEVPRSRVVKQVVGPRIPWSRLERLDDENLDVVDTEIESWVSQDIFQTRASVEYLSLNWTAATLGWPQLSWEMSTPYTL